MLVCVDRKCYSVISVMTARQSCQSSHCLKQNNKYFSFKQTKKELHEIKYPVLWMMAKMRWEEKPQAFKSL